MSKAFTREDAAPEDDFEGEEENPIPAGSKNYLTPGGWQRLREIDRRIRHLTKRLEVAEVVDPATREETDQVFFGATVTYAHADGKEETIRIVGIDETDPPRNYVSWISPVARALIKAREGDTVVLRAPGGDEEIEIVEVRYEKIPMDAFAAPHSAWKPNA